MARTKNKPSKRPQKRVTPAAPADSSPMKPPAPATTEPSHSTLEPPKSTATTTATPPYSSDGPTLPVIGAVHTYMHAIPAPAPAAAPREKTRDEEPESDSETPNHNKKKRRRTEAPAANTNTPSAKPPPKPRNDLAPLYTPWMLLPASAPLRAWRTSFDEKNIVPVVFTRNQNIRSGVNKLKCYLGVGEPGTGNVDPDVVERVGKGEVVIAVSAMGDGTTKLVGIVEMVKRVVGGAESKDNNEDARAEEWCMYTSLGSVVEEKESKRKRRDGDGAEVGEEEEDGVFESLAEIRDKEREAKRSKRTVPVLTVWISKNPIKALGAEFGEQKFRVVKGKEEG